MVVNTSSQPRMEIKLTFREKLQWDKHWAKDSAYIAKLPVLFPKCKGDQTAEFDSRVNEATYPHCLLEDRKRAAYEFWGGVP